MRAAWLRSAALTVLIASGARAELPLTVADLFTEHHRYRVDVSIEYRNREQSDLSLGYVNSVDSAILSGGLRYGATRRTEVFLRGYGYAAEQRQQLLGNTSHQGDRGWNRVVAGINHRFSGDNRTPALLGYLSLVAAEKGIGDDADIQYGAGGSVGLTSYRSLDPLLLSAVVRYDFRGERTVNGADLDPGDSVSVSPQLAFAVNHLVTLTGGVDWEWRESARWLNRDTTVDRTRTSLLVGLGYDWSENMTLSANGRFAVTDSEGSSLGLALVYRF